MEEEAIQAVLIALVHIVAVQVTHHLLDLLIVQIAPLIQALLMILQVVILTVHHHLFILIPILIRIQIQKLL